MNRVSHLAGVATLALAACTSAAAPPTSSGSSTTVGAIAGSTSEPPPPTAATTVPPTTMSAITQAPSTSGPETGGAGEVLVQRDVSYFERDGLGASLDVYRPEDVGVPRLVVLFHPNPVFGATKDSEAELAAAIASRGAVVVVPTYGTRASMTDMFALASEAEVWFGDQGPCAVWAAVDLADDLGADPRSVTLVGDVTGVGPAQMTLFSSPSSVNGCLAPPVDVQILRAILFETDWMWVPDIWDSVIAADPEFIDRMSFWDDLDERSSTAVRLLHGELGAFDTVRDLEGSYLETEWIRLRDPEGALSEAFARSGGLDDGTMSFTDVSVVAVEALVAAGWDAELVTVPGVGHSLSTADSIALVADLVFEDG